MNNKTRRNISFERMKNIKNLEKKIGESSSQFFFNNTTNRFERDIFLNQ